MKRILKFLSSCSLIILASAIITSAICMEQVDELSTSISPKKDYQSLVRRRCNVSTEGRPEKQDMLNCAHDYEQRSKGRLAAAVQKRFREELKQKGRLSNASKTLDLVKILQQQNLDFYVNLQKQFSDEQKTFKSSSSPLFAAELIPMDDIPQREYFYNSIIPQLDVEIDVTSGTLEDLPLSYYGVSHFYYQQIWSAKTSLTLLKALIDNQIGEPVAPQTTPITASQYASLDGTDKVLFAHYLGQAEYHSELATIIRSLLSDLTTLGSTEVNALAQLSQWYEGLTPEINFFKIPDVVSVTTNEVNIDAAIQQQNTNTEKKKKRRKKNRKAITLDTPINISNPQENPARKLQKESNVDQATNVNLKKKKSPNKSQSSSSNNHKETNNHHSSNEESVGEWWLRTENTPSAREIALQQVREYDERCKRKADAKSAKNHLDTREKIQEETISSSEKTEVVAKFPLKNRLPLFQQIMEETYNGEITPILKMIKDDFGGHTTYGSGSRVRLRIRNFNTNQLETEQLLMPEMEDNSITEENLTNQSNIPQENSKTVVHTPHKHKSKRMRPEHIKSIKLFFEKAGYTLDTVGE